MTFWTYILRCGDNTYYTGHTDDLDVRIHQHQTGALKGYTYGKRPLELMWSQDFDTRNDAFTAEMQIKKWSKAKKEALIAGQYGRLKHFAIPPEERVWRSDVSTSLEHAPRLCTRLNPHPPIIILVRPQLGENIGKAARAMLNFGLVDLRLVAPRDGWPNPSAGPAAAGADIVLKKAQMFETLAEATADCAYVYATTVRKRGIIKPVATPAEAATEIHSRTQRSAILFGPERAGLESDDVAVASTIITVPINPEFGSLNLAQAVILVAYEWSKGMQLASPPKAEIDPPAPQAELDGMITQLDSMLAATNYFYPPDRAHIDRRTMRSILTKPGWSAQEVRTVRGMLRSLNRRNSEGSRE